MTRTTIVLTSGGHITVSGDFEFTASRLRYNQSPLIRFTRIVRFDRIKKSWVTQPVLINVREVTCVFEVEYP
jgi:hypothetical protein